LGGNKETGIEKFGVVDFMAETKAADFIAYLEQGRLMYTRCKKCNRSYFSPTGFEDYAPYTVAVVQFSGGVKVFGWLTKNVPSEDIRVGALKVTPLRLPSDTIRL